jgi:CheY-like chemotaxis protein
MALQEIKNTGTDTANGTPQEADQIRILIVEDNPVNVKVLMSSLEEFKYKLLVAQTGSRAVNIAVKTVPELILLDVNLPEMNGFEVCKTLKANRITKDIPIIFLSALDDVDSKVKGLSLGAVDYITKPFYKEEVIKRVETQIEIYKLTQNLREQKKELEKKNGKLQMVLDILNQVQSNIKQSFQRISDSIEYAKRIQHALLPEPANIRRYLPESFVFYRAKAIVSGDLYWFAHQQGRIILATIDCTGHGVPGAFMSVIGHTQLNSIVIEQNILDPGTILEHLDRRVQNTVNKQMENDVDSPLDGMDISLVVIDLKNNQLQFAGANQNLVHVKASQAGNTLEEIKGEKLPIGGPISGMVQADKKFITHTVAFGPGDWFYLFSDGFGDQFGGAEGKKFTRVKLRNLLLEKSQLPARMQHQYLEKAFDEWRGNHEQVDDVTVIGFQPLAG